VTETRSTGSNAVTGSTAVTGLMTTARRALRLSETRQKIADTIAPPPTMVTMSGDISHRPEDVLYAAVKAHDFERRLQLAIAEYVRANEPHTTSYDLAKHLTVWVRRLAQEPFYESCLLRDDPPRRA
jgi:hypothetical protein